MGKLVISNARIVDPATDTDTHGALLIEDGKIADVAFGENPKVPGDAQFVNAGGKIVAPGLIDMRVFVGEPGHEYRETLNSAGKAAAAGGVTTFVFMPDTQPVVDDNALVDFISRRAEAECCVNVLPSAAITKGLQGTELTEFGLLKEAGAAMLTDGKRSIQSAATLRSAFAYAKTFDMLISHHLIDYSLSKGGAMNSGLFATTLGLKGIPREAESIPLARDLKLAQLVGNRYHAAQLSTAQSLEDVARAKHGKGSISAGASINNLTLNELDVGSYRTFFKLSPPLRSEDDRHAMIEGLNAGTIDVLHSAHDPRDAEVKRRPFADAANGAIGLETLLAAGLRLVHDGSVSLLTLLRAITINPARILGTEAGRLAKGAPADLILIDPDYPWVNDENTILSRSKNTAFEGARFTGKVIETYVAGKRVFQHHG